jgi:hypothetical protein
MSLHQKQCSKNPNCKGISHLLNIGVQYKPSIAESTEMAGVMIPSPKNSDAPINQSQSNRFFYYLQFDFRKFKASKAIIPPSPLLSARMTMRHI